MKMNGYLKISFLNSICMFLILTAGCNHEKIVSEKESVPLIEDMSWGPIDVIITASPSTVQYDRDILLTVKVASPTEITVDLPDIQDRLNGFVLNGSYGGEHVEQDGKSVMEKHFRLTPLLSEEHRLAPMAIVYNDKSKNPAVSSWFATRSIVFNVSGPNQESTPSDILEAIKPIWVKPSTREILTTGTVVLAVVLAVVLIWILAHKIHRQAVLRRMSPRERALKELEFLMAKRLPEKHLVKQFYLELTMIVRMYIERAHHIHAPEQTTEEFLMAVSKDKRFDSNVLKTLKLFLEAADLVKFAAFQPETGAINTAAETARTYIESDHSISDSVQTHGMEK